MRILSRLGSTIEIFFMSLIALFIKNKIIWSLLNKYSASIINTKYQNKSQLDILRKDGISKSSIDQFSGLNSIFSEIKKKYFGANVIKKDGSDVFVNKDFFQYILGGNYPKELQFFDVNDPIIKFASHPEIVSIVNNYLGIASSLIYVEANVSNPEACKTLKRKSQKWHRDPGLKGCIKLFVYFNDVISDGHGPFKFIKNTHKFGLNSNVFPQKFFGYGGKYPSEEEIENHKMKLDQISCTGREGMMIFADTTGIHAGGNSYTHSRKMLTLVYYPKFDLQSKRVKINSFSSDLNHFNQEQSYLLGIE